MAFFICVVPVCPVRAEAAHKSEQVTQLLFGEACEMLEKTKDFLRIRMMFDGYEGWCQATQLAEVQDGQIETESKLLAGDWINELLVNDIKMLIPFGSSITFPPGQDAMLGQLKVNYNGNLIEPENTLLTEETVKKIGYTFLNTPYLWGGRAVFGADCSGFTQMVYKCMNIPLLRDAYQQASQGEAIGFLQEAKCGDLAFFDNEAGKITHVGILLNGSTIIHSSGKVRIDAMDNLGIVNSDTGRRTHSLRIIKRIAW